MGWGSWPAHGGEVVSVDSGSGARVRAAFALTALGLSALTLGFGLRQEWATRIWVWDDVRMSYFFLASIAAAVAAPAVWVALSGEFAAWAGVAINGVVAGTIASGYLGSLLLRDVTPDSLGTTLFFVLLTPIAALSFRWAAGQQPQDTRPTPRFVVWSFVFFVAILVTSGTALIFQVDRIFPWNLEPAASTLFGCFFLGAADYFVYALSHPYWVHAAGALWSFLAYDVVLAIPYVAMLGDDEEPGASGGMYGYGAGQGGSDDVNELSLVIYLAVIGVSACIALYAFFVHRGTRIIRRKSGVPEGAGSSVRR